MTEGIKPTWKNTFNSSLGFGRWSDVSKARKYAFDARYPFYEWNGWIYRSDNPSIHPETRICYASELD